MKTQIQGRPVGRTHFKKGELVETGYGAVILLLSDLRVGQMDNIHGVILHSARHPERIGRTRETLFTSSGSIKLFEGKLVLENEKG